MIQFLAGYATVMGSLFLFSALLFGLRTALFGFGLLAVGCGVGILALWWREEHQRRTEAWAPARRPAPLTPPRLPQPASAETGGEQHPWLERAREAQDWEQFEARVAALATRVRAVYPLLPSEEIHKIVWMVAVELHHAQLPADAEREAPASAVQHPVRKEGTG